MKGIKLNVAKRQFCLRQNVIVDSIQSDPASDIFEDRNGPKESLIFVQH